MYGPSDTRTSTDNKTNEFLKALHNFLCASKIADFSNGHAYFPHNEVGCMCSHDHKSPGCWAALSKTREEKFLKFPARFNRRLRSEPSAQGAAPAATGFQRVGWAYFVVQCFKLNGYCIADLLSRLYLFYMSIDFGNGGCRLDRIYKRAQLLP